VVEVGVGGGDFSGEVLVTVREALQRGPDVVVIIGCLCGERSD
jgi:nicotinamidase-related amidase